MILKRLTAGRHIQMGSSAGYQVLGELTD
jgi:hypothetical protein